MSLSSRGLLTKIYDSNNNPSNLAIKKKSTLSFNSAGKKKKIKLKNFISSKINEKEKGNEEDINDDKIKKIKKNIINKEQIKSILEEKEKENEKENNLNKFPIIPKLNYPNNKIIEENKTKIKKVLKIKNTNEKKNQETFDKNILLNYKIIESSSEDSSHPLRELRKGLSGQGWQSSRFSNFPQNLYIQFYQPVLIKRIDLVLHETNIPSIIKFYSFFPKNKDEYISNYKQVNYDYIGFIRTDTNERSNFESRESRKIYINSKALFLKIELEKNHFNNFNLFNQVGLFKLEFIGDYLPYVGGNNKNNTLVLKHATKRNFQNDMDLESICGQKLTELKKLMNYNIEIENYMECKEIKYKIEKLRLYGKRIYDLESEKNIAINNEDFSKAIEIKNLVDKLKININNIDTHPNSPRLNESNLFLNDIDNQTIKTKKYSNIPIDLNNIPPISNSYEFSVINESIISTLNDNNNSNNNNNQNYHFSNKNNNNISILNNTLSQGNNNPVITEDFFGSYDETILPTVLRRLNNEEAKKEEETGEVEKGELLQIPQKLLEEFILIANVIGEENLRKIFSKQILWKEEGLKIVIENINDIIIKNNNSNDIISSILKLSMILLEDKHPSSVIKTLEIIIKLFEYIKNNNIKLDIPPKITDGLLIKIKEKLGDVNPKVRAKSVSLYCYMLSLNFCDYNNLISELVEEDIKNNNKYIPRSSNLILGKLDIFINILNNFDDSIKMKRTDKEEFPSSLVMDYLIYNVSHNKPEVRKKTRIAINLFLKIFGIPKFKKKLERIDERELIKLINEIPDLEKYFPDIEINHKNDTIKISNSKGSLYNKEKINFQKKKISKLFFKKNKRLSKKILKSKFGNKNQNSNTFSNSNIEEKEKQENSNNNLNENNKNKDNINDNDLNEIKPIKDKKDFCFYCKTKMKEDEILANHWTTNCLMYTKCEKCFINIEIQKLNEHRGKECKFKSEYKLCNNCNEFILKNEFDLHKKNKCFLKKGCVKCPLCHQDLNDSEDNFYQHLVTQGCPFQKRK